MWGGWVEMDQHIKFIILVFRSAYSYILNEICVTLAEIRENHFQCSTKFITENSISAS
jgi:hypothetical protein